MKSDIGKIEQEPQKVAEPVILQAVTENGVQKSLLSGSVKKAVWGVLWIAGACWLLLSIGGNPLNELALIRYAQTVPGFIVDTWEDVSDDEHGRTH